MYYRSHFKKYRKSSKNILFSSNRKFYKLSKNTFRRSVFLYFSSLKEKFNLLFNSTKHHFRFREFRKNNRLSQSYDRKVDIFNNRTLIVPNSLTKSQNWLYSFLTRPKLWTKGLLGQLVAMYNQLMAVIIGIKIKVQKKDNLNFKQVARSSNLERHSPNPKVLKYYFAFFLLLALLPLFYFDNGNKSIFLNWVEAQGLPYKLEQEQNFTASVGSITSKPLSNPKLPQVILLKNDPKLDESYSKFQAGLDRQGSWNSDPNGVDETVGILPTSQSQNDQTIFNYESTDEVISEENIGDWVDEHDQDIFDNAVNPFTTVKEDIKKVAFDYSRYQVASGDSLWSISKKFNISIDSIISLNQITSPRGLAVNSKLLIPQMSGIYHKVEKNDSLFKISKTYGVKLEKIKDYNELGGYLQVGKTLFIPGGKYSRFQKDYIFGNIFIVPVRGVLTSTYGFRIHPIKRLRLFHTGIDIAKNMGDRVRVAADGVVVQAGFNGGYGKYIKIKHSMGYETAYAHLSVLWVKPGQKVKKGQFLGRVGNTGVSTGPHLHFEVKHNGKFVNPLRFVKY